MVDNRGINPRYLVPIKKDVIVGFCSISCRGKFLRSPRAYIGKVPGFEAMAPKKSMTRMTRNSRRTTATAPVDPRKSYTGPCEVKKTVKGHYCDTCKRELEQYDTRNGACKRCEKEPLKIDFCAVRLSAIYRAFDCHPTKTSDKPFR